jgi:isopentenyl diphosphate isomerase/L-lactate dehydrogenase-like FMN-dependent dehydrogenase
MLTLLADELRVSLALTGCTDVRRVSREVLIDGLDRST